MAISEAGEMAGSVSGGCVEGAVVEEALASLRSGVPRLLHFGVPDEAAWEVGLACGGQIEIFVETLVGSVRTPSTGNPGFGDLKRCLEEEKPAVRASVVRGPEAVLGRSVLFRDDQAAGDLDPAMSEALGAGARIVLESGLAESEVLLYQSGEVEVFLDPLLPPRTLVIVGGVHIAIVLTQLAKILGFRVVVIDPRRAFATKERFPQADRLIIEWPDEALRKVSLTPAMAIAVLSHDPKLDDPALRVALRSPASYVGVLGSPATHEARRLRLLKAGLTDEELARLHAPIGGFLGGTPEEIALSILADVVAASSVKGARQA
jgi:xanthine dehydrogenase accessory factor